MKISQIAVCLICDEAFNMEEHTECPHCLNTTVWPLHRWIRSLYGGNANIERINHEKSPDSVQETIPMVVGEELYHNGTYLPLHLVQELKRRIFNEEHKKRIDAYQAIAVAKAIQRAQSKVDQSHYQNGILGQGVCCLSEGCGGQDAGHAVYGKISWLTFVRDRIKRSFDQHLCRQPDTVILPQKGEWKSSESVD